MGHLLSHDQPFFSLASLRPSFFCSSLPFPPEGPLTNISLLELEPFTIRAPWATPWVLTDCWDMDLDLCALQSYRQFELDLWSSSQGCHPCCWSSGDPDFWLRVVAPGSVQAPCPPPCPGPWHPRRRPRVAPTALGV